MAHWLVELEGDDFDLEEYQHWFPTGLIFVVEQGEKFFLTGQGFETCSNASLVREKAVHVVEEYSGIIAVLWPGLNRATVGQVIRQADDGSRAGLRFLSASIRVRSKVRATLSVGRTSLDDYNPTRAQLLLEGSRRDRRLQIASLMWADEVRTWPRLYRILEELERFLGAHASKAGLCSVSQRKRFLRSANAAEVAGKDARHGFGKYDPPPGPMPLDEATSVIGGILRGCLRRAGETSTSDAI